MPFSEPLVEGSGVFSELRLSTAFRSGVVVTGTSHTGSFRYHNPAGLFVREIRLPMTPRAVTQVSIARMTEEYGMPPLTPAQAVSRSKYEHRIAFRMETIDDSTFALVHSSVSGAQEDPPLGTGETAWRVFTIDGTPVGVIRFPQWFRPWSVTGDRVLGVLQDSLGTAMIQEYLLEPPSRASGR
jgi:hypothetical protein